MRVWVMNACGLHVLWYVGAKNQVNMQLENTCKDHRTCMVYGIASIRSRIFLEGLVIVVSSWGDDIKSSNVVSFTLLPVFAFLSYILETYMYIEMTHRPGRWHQTVNRLRTQVRQASKTRRQQQKKTGGEKAQPRSPLTSGEATP